MDPEELYLHETVARLLLTGLLSVLSLLNTVFVCGCSQLLLSLSCVASKRECSAAAHSKMADLYRKSDMVLQNKSTHFQNKIS